MAGGDQVKQGRVKRGRLKQGRVRQLCAEQSWVIDQTEVGAGSHRLLTLKKARYGMGSVDGIG